MFPVNSSLLWIRSKGFSLYISSPFPGLILTQAGPTQDASSTTPMPCMRRLSPPRRSHGSARFTQSRRRSAASLPTCGVRFVRPAPGRLSISCVTGWRGRCDRSQPKARRRAPSAIGFRTGVLSRDTWTTGSSISTRAQPSSHCALSPSEGRTTCLWGPNLAVSEPHRSIASSARWTLPKKTPSRSRWELRTLTVCWGADKYLGAICQAFYFVSLTLKTSS